MASGGNLNKVKFDLDSLQNGLGGSGTASFFYTPTSASYIRGAVTIGHQGAEIPAYAFNSRQFGMNYVRDFAGGLTVGLAPNFTMTAYDAALAAFPVARRDRQYAVQVSLLYRKIDFHGLTPRIAYTYIRNDSNIGLYIFRRGRVEIGFTSSF